MVTVVKQGEGGQPAAAVAEPDFSAVEAMANSLQGEQEATAAAQAQAQEQAAVQTEAQALQSALEAARMLVRPMFGWWHEFDSTWGDKTLAGIAEGGAMVMARHGLTLADVLGKWGPYLALAMAAAPPSIVTYQAIKSHERWLAMQAQRGPVQAAQGGANGSDQPAKN